jgi:hypothetical protein
MNKRILELAKQSRLIQYDSDSKIEEVKEFARLLIQECANIVSKVPNGYSDYRNQIEDAMRSDCLQVIQEHFGVKP